MSQERNPPYCNDGHSPEMQSAKYQDGAIWIRCHYCPAEGRLCGNVQWLDEK